jgi:hypothetical protein
MSTKQKKCVIEVLKVGKWQPTWWTGNPDDPDIKPAYRYIAERRLLVAQKRFPHAKFRIVEVEEPSAETIVA